MSLQKNQSLERAEKVLKILNSLIEKTVGKKRKLEKSYYVEQYNNGREEGFCIRHIKNRTNISFAENRTSDHIVVYAGVDFDNMNGNLPSDLAYENAQFFNTEREAAKAILLNMIFCID